jgi:hypothetical protein
MNTRIKELEIQVAQSFDPLVHYTNESYTAEFNRRFASLIIRECAVVAKKAENMWSDDFAWQAILKHFRSFNK